MSGFNAKNISNINKLYKCHTCALILKEPYQLSCGHRHCKVCINEINGNIIKCKSCLNDQDKNDIIPDRGILIDMQSLNIECIACEWCGTFSNYEQHLINNHPNSICEFCNNKFEKYDELIYHKQKICPNMFVPCPLTRFGCPNNILRSSMHEHYLTSIHQSSVLEMLDHNILLNTINDDIVDINIVTSKLTADIKSIQESNNETDTFLSGIKPNMSALSQDITLLKLQVEDTKYVRQDGTLLWKITDIKEKINDARSERQSSIYSPPFYSSPNGYKMCARIYFNGDGNAKGTHMSVFFVLMKGKYDSILKFPFSYKVTFCIYDQTIAGNHIIDSFRPDTKSCSFVRPKNEANVASGIPRFYLLASLIQDNNPYLRDNTMLLKIFVDFEELPKNMITYVMSINPGIPTHIQYKMINEEIAKRAANVPPVPKP